VVCQADSELSAEEKDRCEAAVRAFIEDQTKNIEFAHPSKIRHCYSILRNELLSSIENKEENSDKTAEGNGWRHGRKLPVGQSSSRRMNQRHARGKATGKMKGGASSSASLSVEIDQLRQTIKERDAEIKMLVSMLKSGKFSSSSSSTHGKASTVEERIAEAKTRARLAGRKSHEQKGGSRIIERVTAGISIAEEDKTALKQRQDAFNEFKASYKQTQAMESQKDELRVKYAEAQAVGKEINKKRDMIKRLTITLQQYRLKQGVQNISGEQGTPTSNGNQQAPDETEEQHLKTLRDEKDSYKKLFLHLKKLKQAIEHLQHGLEKTRRQLQRDFERWWKETENKRGQASEVAAAAAAGNNTRVSGTGDPSTDAEIEAFYRARDEMVSGGAKGSQR